MTTELDDLVAAAEAALDDPALATDRARAEAMATAMAALIASAGERARLGAAAARTVGERFTIEVCEPELARRLAALCRRTNPAVG
jgi:hypothetical protein